MLNAAIDFESFYSKEISISTLGVDRYLLHPEVRNDIYLASIITEDGQEFIGSPFDFDWKCLLGYRKWSHNAAFDRRVYYYLRQIAVYERGEYPEDWPDLEHDNWNCTANLAVFHHAGRSLKKAVRDLLGGEVSKDVRKFILGKHSWEMAACPSSTPEFANLWEEVCNYATNDSKWCLALAMEYGPDWPEREYRLSELTIRGCHQGIPLDVPTLEGGKVLLENKIWEVEQKLPWMAWGYEPTSPKGLARACREAGIPPPPSTAEDDPRALVWEEKYGQEYPWVASMRERRKANGLITRINTLLDQQTDGRLVYGIKYFGAHTGRWSGGAREE